MSAPTQPPSRREILLQVLAITSYLGGIALFLWTFVGVYFAPPEGSLSNFATGHAVVLVLAVGFIALGQWGLVRLGGIEGLAYSLGRRGIGEGPQPNKLEQLGYRVEPAETQTEEGDGEYAWEDGDVRVVCPECGARNDPEYQYCHSCSAELPD